MNDQLITTLVGAGIAFGGVLLSMLGQLFHDSRQRNRERVMTLRREVYLPAAESITSLQVLLGRVIDVQDTDVTRDVNRHVVSLSKIYIIGSGRTLDAIAALMNTFMAAYSDLGIRRLPLVKIANEIDGLVAAGGEHHDADRLLKLRLDQARETLAVMEIAFNLSKEFTRLLVPALIEVRKELDLPADQAALHQSFDESLRRQQEVLRSHITQLRAYIDQHS